MNDLVDLAYTKAELAEEKDKYASPMSEQPYAWGLCIRLEKPELEKLGLLADLPDVGDEFHLQCIAKVTGVNQQHREDENDSISVALQITMMGVELREEPDDEKGEAETPKEELAEKAATTVRKTVMTHYN